jgi:hypothetical protein
VDVGDDIQGIVVLHPNKTQTYTAHLIFSTTEQITNINRISELLEILYIFNHCRLISKASTNQEVGSITQFRSWQVATFKLTRLHFYVAHSFYLFKCAVSLVGQMPGLMYAQPSRATQHFDGPHPSSNVSS